MAKILFLYKVVILLIVPLMALSACSTNEATGKQQFTAFMPASSEAKIGAEEHDKIIAQYGGELKDSTLQAYVESVGQKLVPHTERKDVTYTFTVLDSPIINAFALPGGYIYISRGILAHANDEAELASVIGHEIGHVTARHSAQRYSQSVLAGIGGLALSIATNSTAVNQAFGLGANLYLSAYSRSHEHEADNLGIRYSDRAGYDPLASSRFLTTLDRYRAFESKAMGKDDTGNIPNYLSTHPVTADRIAETRTAGLPLSTANKTTNKVEFMRQINGMIYGDTPDQGFVASGRFVHPKIGFMFDIPQNAYTENSPTAFIAVSRKKNGPVMILEGDNKPAKQSIMDYARTKLAKNDFSNVTITDTYMLNGLKAVTVTKDGRVNDVEAKIKMTAIEWDTDTVFVLNQAIPVLTPSADKAMFENSLRSFRRMTATDKSRYKPRTIQVRAAKAGDTIEAIAAKLPFDDGLNVERFRLLNGLSATDTLINGQLYKTIVQ